MRILFICKKGQTYGGAYSHQKASGLFNSTHLIAAALILKGIQAKVVVVSDNNDIDRETALFKPDICVIEALWVVPGKFDVLQGLHPGVKWYVHIHSNIPFLANEGIAIDWLVRYAEKGVGIIANSQAAYDNLSVILGCESLFYLPNIYSRRFFQAKVHYNKEHVDIGCFGAIRPMKNQLLQALAAIRYAKEIGKPLRFHINFTRVEMDGSSILKNLRALFQNEEAVLVEHPWYDPTDFLKYLHKHIDIGLQVSMSETFNVVSADYVTAGIPLVVSDEVSWVSMWNKAEDDSVESVVRAMHFAAHKRLLIKWNQHLLKDSAEDATEKWVEFCEG